MPEETSSGNMYDCTEVDCNTPLLNITSNKGKAFNESHEFLVEKKKNAMQEKRQLQEDLAKLEAKFLSQGTSQKDKETLSISIIDLQKEIAKKKKTIEDLSNSLSLHCCNCIIF